MKKHGNTSKAEFRAILTIVVLLIIGFTAPDLITKFASQGEQSQVIVVYAEDDGDRNNNGNSNSNGNGNLKAHGRPDGHHGYSEKSGYRRQQRGRESTSTRREETFIHCKAFDPNTISMEELTDMGLSNYVAGNIVKYREHGGKFRSAEDLQRIYGMDSTVFNQLTDCIEFPKRSGTFSGDVQLVEVNGATFDDWVSLPGIGQTYASRIIKFRESLGGFYSIDQVAETYGLPEATWQSIRPSLVLIGNHNKLDINSISGEDLSTHPYVSRRQADALINYRQRHGKFNGVEDLRKVYVVGDSWIDKMLPYLDLGSPVSDNGDSGNVADINN